MAYTAPTTRSDTDRITHTIINTDVVDNITYLATKILPLGVIGIFDGTLPTGWTRVSAWDNKFVRGAVAYGGTGGADTHTHTISGTHTHNQNSTSSSVAASANAVLILNPPSANPLIGKTGAGAYTYNYAQSGFQAAATSLDSASTLPPYISVIFAKLTGSSNVYTTPVTRSAGDRITSPIWNIQYVNNIKYLNARMIPVGLIGIFDSDPSVGKYPTEAVTESGSGVDWTNPGNVYVTDGTDATVTLNEAAPLSDYLNASDFDFSISADDTIVGIEVSVRRYYSNSGGYLCDLGVQLLKDGSRVGSDKATATEWATAYETITYGGPTDLWGTTWMPADINEKGFGISYAVKQFNSDGFPMDNCTGRIDSISIKIFTGSGWTRVSAFDGKFVRGAAAYGGTGGATTHTHALASHTHSQNTSGSEAIDAAFTSVGAASGSNSDMYAYSGSGSALGVNAGAASNDALTSGNGDVTPEYLDVLYYKKNAPGSSYTDPSTSQVGDLIDAAKYNARIVENIKHLKAREMISGLILMFDAAAPAGWTRVSALDSKFPRGAAVYGGTGGTATHTHTAGNHTHAQSMGGAAYATSAGQIVAASASGATMYVASGGGADTGMRTGAAANGSATSVAADNLPAYIEVLFYKKD